MEHEKRKEIEMQFRRLFSAAPTEPKEKKENSYRLPGNIQVIRRRKGSPDRHITERPTLSARDLT